MIPLTRGLKISVEKSRAFASRRLSGNIRNDISDITQIGFTNNLGKCLGFKMFQGRPRRDDYLENWRCDIEVEVGDDSRVSGKRGK